MSARPLDLTPREGEILGLIGNGLSNKQIARHLLISESTVSTHLERLFARNGLHTRGEALALWFQSEIDRHDSLGATDPGRRPQPAVGRSRPRLRRAAAWLGTPLLALGVASYLLTPTYLLASLRYLVASVAVLIVLAVLLGLAQRFRQSHRGTVSVIDLSGPDCARMSATPP